jgi:hypothetical protein
MIKAGASLPDALVYDNACTLRMHWNKVFDTRYFQRNEYTEQLYNMRLVLDRFHQKGHTQPMCKQIMNADNDAHGDIFKNINTSICEQSFSFLAKFRFSLRSFNYPTSTLFALLLFHLKNCRTSGIKASAFGLGQSMFAANIRSQFDSPCIFEAFHFTEPMDNDKEEDDESNQEELEE